MGNYNLQVPDSYLIGFLLLSGSRHRDLAERIDGGFKYFIYLLGLQDARMQELAAFGDDLELRLTSQSQSAYVMQHELQEFRVRHFVLD